MTYRIRDWEKHFENCESKRYKTLNWIPVPNRHDGKRYRRVMRHPQAAEIFAAWILMLQVASRAPTRGYLVDREGGLTPQDLEDATGLPQTCYRIALDVLTSPEIAWIEQVKEKLPQTCRKPAADLPQSCGNCFPEQTRPDSTRTDQTGTELNRIFTVGSGSEEPPADDPTGDTPPSFRTRDYSDAKPLVISDYADIEAIPDPILAAISVTQETQKPAWGYWIKILSQAQAEHHNGQAERLFRGCLAATWGEMRQGEVRKPGAILNRKLQDTFGTKGGNVP